MKLSAMKLSVAPVFPIWLIVACVVTAVLLRVGAVIASGRRRGRLPDGRTWLRLGVGVLAIVCLGLASIRVGDESEALRPPRLVATAEESNVNVFLVVDRSLAMDTDDFDGREKRLTGAVRDMQTIVAKYPNARFSVLSYADSARVEWPLSPDTWSLVPFVVDFTPYGGKYSYEGGTNPNVSVAASGPLLQEELNTAARDYPGSANLVYLFGSSSDPGDWAFDISAALVSGGGVFGYGTEEGERVYYSPPGNGAGRSIKYKLNEPALETAAQSLQVPYRHRESGALPADALASADLPQVTPIGDVVAEVPHPNRIEYYWLFAALAAVLFGVELHELSKHWLRRRSRGVRK